MSVKFTGSGSGGRRRENAWRRSAIAWDSEVSPRQRLNQTSRRYRQFARTIAPDEIRRVWPHADVEQVLREDDQP